MIIFKKGNLFDSDCQTLVNTINCDGVMGKGLALQFKQRYPDMFNEYRYACKKGIIKGGGYLWVFPFVDNFKLRNILCFATKEHWYYPSKIEWIETGLKSFAAKYKEIGITSIAWPKLGCTNGKLDWENQVKPLMVKYLDDIDILNEIYE